MCNESSIKSAVLIALNKLGRTGFSEGGFTKQQADGRYCRGRFKAPDCNDMISGVCLK